MKIQINSEEFKSVAERVMAVYNRHTVVPFMDMVHITAEDGIAEFRMTNGDEYVSVVADHAFIIEPGCVSISANNIKNLFNVKGDCITIEALENKVRASSSKKKTEVPATKFENEAYGFMPKVKTRDSAMTAIKDAWFEVLGNLSKCLATDGINKLLSSYHFLSDRIEALDSHMLGVRWLDWNTHNIDIDAIIPGCIYKSLKKIVSKNEQSDIVLYLDDRYAEFIGSDFNYVVKLTEGKFFDTSRLLNMGMNYEFKVDAKELNDVSKEYAKLTKNITTPMIWHFNSGEFQTYLMLGDYRTMDNVEVIDRILFPEDLNIGLNPALIEKATGVFAGDITIWIKNRNEAILIEQGEYNMFVLPVNISNSGVEEKIRAFN